MTKTIKKDYVTFYTLENESENAFELLALAEEEKKKCKQGYFYQLTNYSYFHYKTYELKRYYDYSKSTINKKKALINKKGEN